MGTNPGLFRTEFGSDLIALKSTLRTPDGMYEWCRATLQKLVGYELQDRKTVGAALSSICKEGRLGITWANKIWKGQKVGVPGHIYVTLCDLLDAKAAEWERRTAHDREIARALRGSDAAIAGHSASADGGSRAGLRAA